MVHRPWRSHCLVFKTKFLSLWFKVYWRARCAGVCLWPQCLGGWSRKFKSLRAVWATWDHVTGMPEFYLLPEVILFDNVFKSFPDTKDSFPCFETEFHSVALVSLVFTVQPKLASNSWQLSCLIFMSTEMTGVNHHIWLSDVELWGSVPYQHSVKFMFVVKIFYYI